MREVDFADGLTSASEPTKGSLDINAYKTFASTAAFVADKGSAAADGDAFYDTALDVLRVYQNGAWVSHAEAGKMTTKGDLLSYSTLPARLGVGSDNQVLTADSAEATGLKWAEAASGEGGINYISNGKAETDTTGWATYADAAGEDPVDGTGGSAGITWTRTTSSPLRGTGSFLMTKGASDLQGDGVSYDFSIDAHQSGRRQTITFWYEGSANIVAGESSDVRVWIYDKDNSVLVAPSTTWLGSASGVAVVTFDATDAVNYRLIFHIATTNASAWTLKVDQVSVGPQDAVLGLAGSNWIDYTPTYTNFGTVTTETAKWRRVGPNMEGILSFTLGTTVNADAAVSLPSGYALENNAVSTGQVVGEFSTTTTGVGGGNIFIRPSVSTSNINFGGVGNPGISGFDPLHGTSIGSATASVSVKFTVPISGWDANVSLANGSTFRMSSILASGSRITGTPPAKLGEYRSYLRNGSAKTFTETNGAPTASPSATDGIRIYNGNAWAVADTNNEPTRYDIFIGKNKHYRLEWYASAGKTGYVNTSPHIQSTTDYGYLPSYDPTTGILTLISTLYNSGSRTAHVGGNDVTGIDASNDPYFDIVVSENALAVGVEVVNSSVNVDSGNGHGSTNTKIRRYSNSTVVGTAITYADSAANGGSFTINQNGIYHMQVIDTRAAGSTMVGISVNSSQLTTNIESITHADRVTNESTSGAGLVGSSSGMRRLYVGDVVRMHDDGGPDSSGAGGGSAAIIKVAD